MHLLRSAAMSPSSSLTSGRLNRRWQSERTATSLLTGSAFRARKSTPCDTRTCDLVCDALCERGLELSMLLAPAPVTPLSDRWRIQDPQFEIRGAGHDEASMLRRSPHSAPAGVQHAFQFVCLGSRRVCCKTVASCAASCRIGVLRRAVHAIDAEASMQRICAYIDTMWLLAASQ